MGEGMGKIYFYTVFFGFNLAFFPMHILGMTGMPRRTHTYKSVMGWDDPNFWSTVGAFILGIGIAGVVLQVVYCCFKGKPSGDNPWDARTLEWATSNPPKEYNFGYTPVIKARDQVWENKHGPEEKKMEKIAPDSHGIHMPDQSWWPLVVSIGMFVAGMGVIFNGQPMGLLLPFLSNEATFNLFHITVPGLGITFLAIYLWALEGPGGYHLHPEKEELE
jgi:cytochrome c oxidase subunit 1